MNDLEYLNQISAGVVKPAQPTGFFDKKMKIIIGAVVGALVLLIVIAIASSSSTPETTDASELSRLYFRANSLSETISKYNGSVRSSTLRSTGASFSTLLTEITSSTSSYLTDMGIEPDKATGTAEDEESLAELTASLEKARLNGILDRNFASGMYYQIRYLLVIESIIYDKTSDTNLQSYLDSSYVSLERLGETFSNFSESN